MASKTGKEIALSNEIGALVKEKQSAADKRLLVDFINGVKKEELCLRHGLTPSELDRRVADLLIAEENKAADLEIDDVLLVQIFNNLRKLGEGIDKLSYEFYEREFQALTKEGLKETLTEQIHDKALVPKYLSEHRATLDLLRKIWAAKQGLKKPSDPKNAAKSELTMRLAELVAKKAEDAGRAKGELEAMRTVDAAPEAREGELDEE